MRGLEKPQVDRLFVYYEDACGVQGEAILPYWRALIRAAQLFGWAPAGEMPIAAGPKGRRSAAQQRSRVCGSFGPGVRERLSAHEADELADAIERALPDAGTHEQFLEIENKQDVFLTVASPLQWLGLDRDWLVSRLLPSLRRGPVDLCYDE